MTKTEIESKIKAETTRVRKLTLVNFPNVPQVFRSINQWHVYRFDPRKRIEEPGGYSPKLGKPPVSPSTGNTVSWTDPKNFLSFDQAVKHLKKNEPGNFAGIGLVFTGEEPFSGVDIDSCIDQAGKLTKEAQGIIDRLNSYTEISPSGTGIRIIGAGKLQKGDNGGKCGDYEAYSAARFLTITGNVFQEKTNIREFSSDLAWFRKSYATSKKEEPPLRELAPRTNQSGPLSNDEILKIISKAKNGAKIQDLMNSGGDSEGDAALINCFVFYTKDISQLERLMRSTNRTREKWDEKRGKDNFLVYQIKRLLKNYQGGAYEPKRSPQKEDALTSDTPMAKPLDPFWYEGTDQKGNPSLHIDAKKLLDFLEQNGFCKRYVDDQQSILLRVVHSAIEETTPEKAADLAHQYILSLPDQISPNFQQYDLIKKCFSPNFPYFTEKQLKKFLPTELTFHRDDKNHAFFYYKNGVIEITKTGKILRKYSEIQGTIWKRWILNRKYVVPTNQNDPGDFEKFIQLICKGDKKRAMALMTAMGYLIHRYKNPALTKAIILVDEKIAEIPEGRSGKSLLAKALGKFRNLTNIDGKDFDFDSRFAFQDVSYDTELICFDDVKRNFDFERLFHKITDGLEVERKGQHRFKIAREDSAKFIITTNFMVMGEGGSSEGRRAEYELHAHFSREHTPKDEFGKLFFDEWDTQEWARFDAFILDCVQLFLAHGLLTADPVNIARRKIIQSTCPEFLSWADSFFRDEAGNLNESVMVWHSKKTLFDSFLASSEDHKHEEEKGKFKRQTFSRWLSTYCLQSKIKIEDKKSRATGRPENGFTFSIGSRSA